MTSPLSPGAVDRVNPQTSWFLPVAGMSSKPSKFDGENPAWATGSYGYKKPQSKGGHVHKGCDIYAKHGAQIVASVRGTVTASGYNKTSGYYLKMKGMDGIEYFYAHLGEKSPLTSGTKVSAGSQLGIVGNTGNASGTSAHLHFEMRKGGKSINPNDWLSSGRQQQFSTISAVPGVNSPEELMAWAQEQRAQMGLDYESVVQKAQRQPNFSSTATMDRNAIGTSVLGGMFDSLSNQVAGGTRTPVPRIPGMGSYTPSGESDIQTQTPTEMRAPDPEQQTMENG